MSSGRRCHMMRRACFAPAVYKLSCAAGKTGSHIGVSEGQDLALLVNAFCYDKLEVTVTVLRNRKIRYRAGIRIELRQIAAAGLAVEYLNNL